MRIHILSLLLVLAACASNKQVEQKTAPASESASAVAKAAPESTQKPAAVAEQKAKAVCKKNEEERVLEAVNLETGGCEVKYTKGGKTSSVASSVHSPKHCLKVVEKMKANLVKAGFACG